MRFSELMPIFQAAVSPVILISGVGLLLLSMTNRFGRLLDRSRQLGDALRHAPPSERSRLRSQLTVLIRRGRLLRVAITFAVFSVLLASILVLTLFLTAFWHAEAVLLGASLFMGCLVSLIISLLAFLQDINLSLAALNLEFREDDDRVA